MANSTGAQLPQQSVHRTLPRSAALGDLVFTDPAARRRLNKAMHLPVVVSLLWQVRPPP